jgi:hypothetical protein
LRYGVGGRAVRGKGVHLRLVRQWRRYTEVDRLTVGDVPFGARWVEGGGRRGVQV